MAFIKSQATVTSKVVSGASRGQVLLNVPRQVSIQTISKIVPTSALGTIAGSGASPMSIGYSH